MNHKILLKLTLLLICLVSCGKNEANYEDLSPTISGSWHSVIPIVIVFPMSRKDQIEQSVHNAISSWNSAIGSSFLSYTFEEYDENDITPENISNYGMKKVYFIKSGEWSKISSTGNALAVTYVLNSRHTGNIVDSHIIFNQTYNFSYTDSIGFYQYDFESVLVHEIGHFLGLNHVSVKEDSDSVMNSSISSGVQKRLLSNHDISSIVALYPNP